MVLRDFDVSYAMYKVLMVIKGSTLACDVIYGIYKLLSQCVGEIHGKYTPAQARNKLLN